MFVKTIDRKQQKPRNIAENLHGSNAEADFGILIVRPRVVEFLGSENYFKAPLNISNVFN